MRKHLVGHKSVDNECMPGAKQPSEDHRVWMLLKQYLATIHHRWRFAVAIIVIFVLGALFVYLAKYKIHPDNEPWQGLAEGLGDAFIIAAVVALLVDPVAQQQFATEWGRDLYWAIFSPHAPRAFATHSETLRRPMPTSITVRTCSS